MLFLLNFLVSLDLNNLEIKIKNYTIFQYKTASVLSYVFLREFHPNKFNKTNFFLLKNEDSSELFFYKIETNDCFLGEKRYHMIENDNPVRFKYFKISYVHNCDLIEIYPEFKIGKPYDNYQKIKVKNLKKFSKIIWDIFLKTKLNIDKKKLKNIIYKILNEPLNSLKLIFDDYPLLHFCNKAENIYYVFKEILKIIDKYQIIDYDITYNLFKNLTGNYIDNRIMIRYHEIKGPEINRQSVDYFLSCLFTDISNILGYYEKPKSFRFTIYNFIECDDILFGEYFVGFKINMNIKNVKRDKNNNLFIYVFDRKTKNAIKFFTIVTDNEFFIMIKKILCLNNSYDYLKIIIHTQSKIYESKFLDITKYIFD